MHAFLLHFMACSADLLGTDIKKNGLYSCSHVTYAKITGCTHVFSLTSFCNLSAVVLKTFIQSCVHVLEHPHSKRFPIVDWEERESSVICFISVMDMDAVLPDRKSVV